MSSHREAPAISRDPVADNTDTYAFVSPDDPATVTIIANYLPLEAPFGGPNFFEFGPDVRYRINIDNNGDGEADIIYEFAFETRVGNPNSFLYNTGSIDSIGSPNWNRKQFYSATRISHGRSQVLAEGLACPPCNVGVLSTPNYDTLAGQAIHGLPGGRTVFAGQRLEGFYVDLGSIFDLGNLRPFENLHIGSLQAAAGVNATNDFSVHSIALNVPKSDLTRNGSDPTNPTSENAVVGVWASASRQAATIRWESPSGLDAGDWVQVSRLGNPLFNEVLVGMGSKDTWNSLPPAADSQFAHGVRHPELQTLLPVLYPGVFPNLAKYSAPRADLVAILLTGIPSGIVPGFQNYTGSKLADMLRLNLAIPPAAKPNPLGIVGGDLAGFPNGRRVFDDVVSVELRAIAGATIPLVDKSFTPDKAATLLTDGLDQSSTRYLSQFPYLGTPQGGYQTAPLGTL
ncbi:MAG: DUF4331 domain-containing protein [Solirubrobacterales bacterium]|nr:DUF4331 domain-containing protein [Solirubrobacterales bacterium]MBV9367538.1 DUF4331 domain-containing protein [Solirubrobacterales bacterium]MBV9683412.1 DUF4331 domain-containing protein [Solirubrobacterales bacterium]